MRNSTKVRCHAKTDINVDGIMLKRGSKFKACLVQYVATTNNNMPEIYIMLAIGSVEGGPDHENVIVPVPRKSVTIMLDSSPDEQEVNKMDVIHS